MLASDSRAYWAAYWAERLRLDAKTCSKGTPCGNTCIPKSRECKRGPSGEQSKQRLETIAQKAAAKPKTAKPKPGGSPQAEPKAEPKPAEQPVTQAPKAKKPKAAPKSASEPAKVDQASLRRAGAKIATVAGVKAYNFAAGTAKQDPEVMPVPPPKLPRTQQIAVNDYVRNYEARGRKIGGFNQTQAKIRSGESLTAKEQKIVDGLDAAIASQTLKVDTVVYRGMSGPIADRLAKAAKAGQLKAGTPISDKGYVSTTLSDKIVDSFVGEGDRVVIRAVAKAGMNAIYPNGHLGRLAVQAEREVLFPRGTGFRVQKVRRKDGVIYIDAEVY